MPHFLHSAVIAAVLATAPPLTATDAPPADAARLVGAWDCSGSTRGSTSTFVYNRADDATFILQAIVHTAFGVTGNVTETYAYDRKNGTWMLSAGRSRFFDGIRLTAKSWTSSEWIFSGTEATQGTSRAIRIVYAFVAPDSFVRRHQTSTEGRWLEDGTLTCRRSPSIGVRPSPKPHETSTPSSRPSMQPAVAALPHGLPPAPPAPGTGTRPGATPTPLPIPGIVPAQIATAQPAATRSARRSSMPVRPSPRPDSTPVAQTTSGTPPGERLATVRASSVPTRFSPSPATVPSVPAPSAQPSGIRSTARPSPPVQPSAVRLAAARPASVPTRSAPRPAGTPTPEGDRAYRLIGNTWACETLGGLPATHTYALQSDGEIKLHNVLTIAKHQYAIDEIYRFDSAKNVWTTTTGAGAYAGVAPKWLHENWVFEGTMQSGSRRVRVQMIYSTLGENAFRRDFVKLQDGTSKTFAAETCHRP